MKKALSLILAVVLVFGMTTMASAAAAGKIESQIRDITATQYTDITVNPGKEIQIPLTANIFEWSEGTGGSNEPVTSNQISKGKVTVKVKYNKSKSKDIIKDITLKTGGQFSECNNQKTAYIKVEFVEDYDSTKTVEFDFTVYLSVNGKQFKDYGVEFTGEFERKVDYIDEDEDYVDMSGGEMFEPDGYIREIECYLGSDTYIKTKMYQDKQYYGTAEAGIKEEDEVIADAYPEIDEVITISTNMTSGKVYFDLGDKYHVYDADGKYVGTTEDEFKYSKKFYFATEKINLGGGSSSSSDDDDDDDDDEVIPVEEDDDDGNDYVYTNAGSINDNPSTGAKQIVNIAAIMGLAAVAIFCTIPRKKL